MERKGRRHLLPFFLPSCYNPGVSHLPPLLYDRSDNLVGGDRRLRIDAGAQVTLDVDGLHLNFSDTHVVQVSKDGPDFSTIADAIDWINLQADASEATPYIIQVGPGVWAEYASLPAWVSLRGSGQGVTILDYEDISLSINETLVRLRQGCTLSDVSVAVNNFGTLAIEVRSLYKTRVLDVSIIKSAHATDGGGIAFTAAEYEGESITDHITRGLLINPLGDLTEGEATAIYAGDSTTGEAIHIESVISRVGPVIITSFPAVSLVGAKLTSLEVGQASVFPMTATLLGCEIGSLSVGEDEPTAAEACTVIASGCSFGSVDILDTGSIHGSWTDPTAQVVRLSAPIEADEEATPAAPASGRMQIYPKAGAWYQQDPAGDEYRILTALDGSADAIYTELDGDVLVTLGGDVGYAL